ncbi:GtrA family protein [Yinghuangia soli]|uniref:GtrA family protein n=1 Tax=Yinghuangia soli TaxID=2908204 RepID=A0AA41PXA2_9ACTN|nr:GtrA family protein [Yinghuangia soli]MCF2527396.1 GtrA family protein [Yinghuangia soli]
MNSSASTAAAAAKSNGPLASFVRFVAFGGGTGLAASGVLLFLSGYMSLVLANALVTVASTIVANELHSRLTFRSAERGWRMHLKSTGTVAVSYLFTTTAMLVLHAVVASPSVLLDQAVYLTASGLAGIGRFAVLRVFVFAAARGGAAKAPQTRPAVAPVLAPRIPAFDRTAVAVAA